MNPTAFLEAHPDERLQFYCRQHWIRLLAPFSRMVALTLLLVAIGIGLLGGIGIEDTTSRRIALVLLTGLFCVVQWEFLVRYYHYFLHVFIVTDRRVHRVKKTLLAHDDQQSIDMESLQDVHKWQHGIIQNIFGFGTLVLEAQETVLRLHFVPGISQRHEALMQLLGKGSASPTIPILPASDETIEKAVAILRGGGVIAHATETCYGLACDLTNQTAVERLFALKHRPPEQPVSALFPNIETAKKYVVWNEEAERQASAHLPGPLTLILPLRKDAPHHLLPTPAGGESIGMRVSSHPIAQMLTSAFGRPISTTSANIHGGPNPYNVADMLSQFRNSGLQPDLVLNSGELPKVPPSTVLDLRDPQRKILHRPGDIDPELGLT